MLDVREEHIDMITEVFHLILSGRIPEPVELPKGYPDNEIKQIVEYVNRFVAEYSAFADILSALSRGELDFEPSKSQMHILQSFKNLHGNLRHLTWKTQQIANGEFTQQVDFMGEFSRAFNRMTQQLQSAFAKIEQQNQELQEAWEKSDSLLLSVLPPSIVERLKQGENQIADSFADATALVAEIVDFSLVFAARSPVEQVDVLRQMFCRFDRLVEDKGLQKLKAMGVTYYAVGGVPEPHPDPVRAAAEVALAMQTEALDMDLDDVGPLSLRIGISCGPVVAGVVGASLLGYDVWGQTMNMAQAMQTSAPPSGIQITQAACERLGSDFVTESRGAYYVAGLGEIECHLLEGAQNWA